MSQFLYLIDLSLYLLEFNNYEIIEQFLKASFVVTLFLRTKIYLINNKKLFGNHFYNLTQDSENPVNN